MGVDVENSAMFSASVLAFDKGLVTVSRKAAASVGRLADIRGHPIGAFQAPCCMDSHVRPAATSR